MKYFKMRDGEMVECDAPAFWGGLMHPEAKPQSELGEGKPLMDACREYREEREREEMLRDADSMPSCGPFLTTVFDVLDELEREREIAEIDAPYATLEMTRDELMLLRGIVGRQVFHDDVKALYRKILALYRSKGLAE